MKECLNKLPNPVIGAATEVHGELGAGLLETTYKLSLQPELQLMGISVSRQVTLPLNDKALIVPEAYRVDLLVEDCLMVEIKTGGALAPIHSAQVLTHLRMLEKQLGLLINFHSIRLADRVKRLVHNFPS